MILVHHHHHHHIYIYIYILFTNLKKKNLIFFKNTFKTLKQLVNDMSFFFLSCLY